MQETQEAQKTDQQEDSLDSLDFQVTDDNICRKTGIDLSLPSPRTPNDVNVIVGYTDEVCGGMDGGSKEKTINLQDGVTKGGILPHVLHEGLEYDHRNDHRTSRSDKHVLKQQDQQLQQQNQKIENWEQTATEKMRKQQQEKLKREDQGKQGDTKDTEDTPKSKNKPSKQKRDAEKRRQNRQQEKNCEQEKGVGEEPCNKFVMVDDNQGLDIPPLQIQYMTPHNSDKKDKMQQGGKENPTSVLDEYAVINSEDELGGDNQSLDEYEDNDETSEALIRAFSPNNDHSLDIEIQQVTKNQCLSPRSFQQNRFHFTKQDANTVTAGRPNTRLFSSKSSQ
ncbi:hypothetical protein EJD97_006217 [Solanum chilense]|uniref:Uncharacterized protein n=1 Tax=Solanum chilense TaxID=4083 RepID=A0A6N2AJ44_SOLCI|nr:hypothetical protein EJD97_006217 [Solanum chilense]